MSDFPFPHLLQGVQYLVENGLLEWRAESVAEFLYKEEGLNKTAIGNFLGERWSISISFPAPSLKLWDLTKKH